MSITKVDNRDRAKILAQLNELSLQYVPELISQTDANYALKQIFSYMAEYATSGLNQVPKKNFLVFLGKLGLKLAPAQPARVPLTFLLTEGVSQDVVIPARTAAATPPQEGAQPVVFETEKIMNATVSQLTAVFSVDPKKIVDPEVKKPHECRDEIYNHLPDLAERSSTELFEGTSIQQHALYLGHENLFNLRKGVGSGYVLIYLQLLSPQGTANLDGVAWEYYGYSSHQQKTLWLPLQKAPEELDGYLVLKKSDPAPTEPIVIQPAHLDLDCVSIASKLAELNVNGETFWIRARVKGNLSDDLALLTMKPPTAHIKNQVPPEVAFYNDVPIDLTNDFYPFGTLPKPYDSFYIGCQEAFSKKESQIHLTFALKIGGKPMKSSSGILLLSWEYWNGKAWCALKDLKHIADAEAEKKYKQETSNLDKDPSYRFQFNGGISFTCPKDIVASEINGKKNFWLRIRLVSGNYGAPIYENGSSKVVQDTTGTPSLAPPIIKNVSIVNIIPEAALRYCFAKNNLQITDCTNLKAFKPFEPIEEKRQTLWLGFNKPFGNGRISIFFSVENQIYPQETKPQFTWSYFRSAGGRSELSLLQVLDTTDNLTRSGTIEFVGPSDAVSTRKFGQSLYWIRGEVTDGAFQTQKIMRAIVQKAEAAAHRSDATTAPLLSIGTCIKIFHTTFGMPKDLAGCQGAPLLKGIYPNTTWATQSQTVIDEVLGTSNGLANQTFTLRRVPVVSEQIWVNESLTPQEANQLPQENKQVSDTSGLWVKWIAVEDFSESNDKSRHYTIDRVTGQVTFGDGRNGLVPSISASIKTTYQTGGGSKGNIAAGQIKNLVTSIAFVDKAVNPDSAQGGADTEFVEKLLEKGPSRIKHRMRAVTKEDFEGLAKEASRAVARAECIPNLDGYGQRTPGCVALIIVPESTEDRPMPSPELLKIVKDYIKARNAATTLTFTVTHPTYVSISISATLYVTSIDAALAIRSAAIERLTEFMHPLRGGYDGTGWPFGSIPCYSDFLDLLSKIDMVSHIEDLTITLQEEEEGISYQQTKTASVMSSELAASIALPQYALVCNGTHQIDIKWETEG